MSGLLGRGTVVLLGLLLLTGPVQAASIGIVSNEKIAMMTTIVKAFKETVGVNPDKVAFSSIDVERAAEISGTDFNTFDLVFVTSVDCVKIIAPHTQKPIVIAIIFDPATNSLESAGQNITGVALNISAERQAAILKEILPSAKTVGVFYGSAMRGFITKAKPAFAQAGLNLNAVTVDSFAKMAQALEGMKGSIDAFWVIPDSSLYDPESISYVLKNFAESHVPVMGFGANVTKAGALFSCAYDFDDVGRQAGEIALRILNGTNPVSIGIVAPRRISYSFNRRIKEFLGITVAPQTWAKAQEIF